MSEKALLPIAVVGAAAAFLFWPMHDLEIKASYSSPYEIVEKNFFTLDSCRKAADTHGAFDYFCLKHTGWGQMTNTYSIYDSKTK